MSWKYLLLILFVTCNLTSTHALLIVLDCFVYTFFSTFLHFLYTLISLFLHLLLHNFQKLGIRAVVLDGAVVQTNAMVAAGALVKPGVIIPSGELWGGTPARKLRDLT